MFFEMPLDESTLPDDHFIEIDDTPTFQTTSAKLNFANTTKSDPLQGQHNIIYNRFTDKYFITGVGEPRQFLVQNLATLSSSQPGKLPALISNINQQAQTIVQQYLTKFGIQLV
jgi:exportin-2 (importin alpha re-exporter)